jgi:Tfp pilus assembly protein PilO
MNRVFPLLALIIAIAIFFGYVNATWTGSIATTQAAIANDDQALTAASEYTSRQNELASARNAIDPASLARLNAFLPDSVDNVGLILDLNALAARSGLSLASIDVAADQASGASSVASGSLPASGQDPVGSVDLSLSASGTYAALQSFLTGVEASERILDVTDLTVRGSDTGVYTYQMTVRLYWLR